MIFTRRFGALAARRVFPAVTETEQERDLDLPIHDSGSDQASETKTAEKKAA